MRLTSRSCVGAWALVALVCASAAAQPVRPQVVDRVDLERLAGTWFEVASTGGLAPAICATDTRHRLERDKTLSLKILTLCTARGHAERRTGRVRAGRGGDGRLSIRYALPVLAWTSSVWRDFWVLALADDGSWMLMGDRRRRSLAVWARTVSLAESSLAAAIAVARAQGFGPDRLRPTLHPAGPTGLAATDW